VKWHSQNLLLKNVMDKKYKRRQEEPRSVLSVKILSTAAKMYEKSHLKGLQ